MQDVSDDGSCNKFINRPYAEVKKGFTYCADGDVIFAKITPCMENGKGAELQGLTNAIGMGSTEFHVLRPISGKSISTWLYHFTKLDIIRKDAAKNMTGTGGQKRVPASYFDNFKIGVPSIDEQMNFAALANQADKSKFGDFKSQFIEMTTMSELNKKSIGEIAEVRTGSTPSRSNPEYWNGTHYWVSAQDMGNKYIYDTLEKITDKGYATCKVVPAGSILYVCRGSIGVMSINTMDCATNQSICTATCKKGYNTEYLYYALKVAEKTIKKQGIGTSFKSLNQSAFSSIEILFPAIEIQDKFAAIAKQADKSKSYVRIALKNLESILGYCIRQVA